MILYWSQDVLDESIVIKKGFFLPSRKYIYRSSSECSASGIVEKAQLYKWTMSMSQQGVHVAFSRRRANRKAPGSEEVDQPLEEITKGDIG